MRKLDPYIASVILLGILATGFALSPSSYAIVLDRFGVEETGLVLGTPRAIRADEYAIWTPQVQIALRNGLERTNETSPYREDLRTPYSLPLLDWGLAFKPQFWLFPVAEPEWAYSFYHAVHAVAFLIGYYLLLQAFGFRRSWSALGTLTLFFSGFVQLWWTSLGQHTAILPWILLAIISSLQIPRKLVLLTYLFAVWLLSAQFYPPYVLSLALAGGVAVVAFRPRALDRATLATIAASALIAGLIVASYLWDALPRLIASANHGQRALAGGGVGLDVWLGQLLPLAPLHGFQALRAANVCEASSAGSYLLLLILCFVDWPATRQSFSRIEVAGPYRRLVLWLLTPFVAMSIWMLAPLSAFIGGPLLWHLMPATRLLFASGFLLLLFGMATLARVTLRASPQRAALFCGIVATSWLAKYAASDLQWSDVRFDEALVLAPLVFAMLALPAWQVGFRTWMLAVAAVANVAAFAFFNPIQSARPIFADHSTSLMQELAQEQAAHPRGWLVRGGFRGSVLNGMGFRAINHALILPEVEFFRPMFPQLTDAELNAAFNRYGMISPALRAPRRDGGFVRITRPVALPTAVWVPEEPFRMESEAAHGRRTEESDPGFEAPARGAISPTTR